MTAFWLGMVAGYGIAIPVGAIAVLIVNVGMRCGFRCGASAGAGAATADLAYAGIAVGGGVALTRTIASVGQPLRWVSAGLLALIAARGLWRARHAPPVVRTALPLPKEYAATYVKFLGLTAVNPMTIVYFAVLVVGLHLTDGLDATQRGLFVAGAFLASLSWQTLLAGLGAFAGRALSHGLQLGATIFGNVLVLAMAALIVLR